MDKLYIGTRTSELEFSETLNRISRITLLVDDEHVYTAGNDTGRTIELDCPWGSQRMANSILASVKDVDYKPFTGTSTLLDPAAEIGDGVTIGGMYSMLVQADIEFDKMCAGNISAPESDEIDDEYPYKSPQSRKAERQLAHIRSTIRKTAEEIQLEVQGLNDQVGSISTKVDSIKLNVKNGSTSSTIELTAGDAIISSQNIEMNGLVTFTGLRNGTTTINGACIKTGTIDAERLNLTGAITFTDLDQSTQETISDIASDARSALTSASNASKVASSASTAAANANTTLKNWTYSGTTYIDGNKLMTGTVAASILEGGMVGIYTSDDKVAGHIVATGASSANFALDLTSNGALRFETRAGDIFINAAGYSPNKYIHIKSDAIFIGQSDLRPTGDGVYDFGWPNNKWNDLYAKNAEIQTSDRNEKHSIDYDMSGYDNLFDSLKPCSYKFNISESDRTHLGMIAQDIEETLSKCKIDTQDFAPFVKFMRTDEDGNALGEYGYGLRYSEFIALLIYQTQKLKQRVSELEDTINARID